MYARFSDFFLGREDDKKFDVKIIYILRLLSYNDDY